jgi:hypothetical protein
LVFVALFAYISAVPVPADEALISDNIDNAHPAEDDEILKLLILKKLLLKKALLLG